MNDSMTSPEPAFSICVYCGSRPGRSPAYAETARAVGQWIGTQGGQLVYGGGRAGLMGEIANDTLAAGGRVVGVIPRALVEREHAHRGCTELHVVENMHERKRLMAERADAFLALPGGIGTFEELFETWTWRQLGYHNKPIGVLNQDGYYDHLLTFMHHSVDEGFMDGHQWDLIATGTAAEPLLKGLVTSAGFPKLAKLDGI